MKASDWSMPTPCIRSMHGPRTSGVNQLSSWSHYCRQHATLLRTLHQPVVSHDFFFGCDSPLPERKLAGARDVHHAHHLIRFVTGAAVRPSPSSRAL